MLEDILPEGWETDGYGLDSLLICPHGRTLEQDGWHTITADEAWGAEEHEEAGQRCVSPLRRMGMI